MTQVFELLRLATEKLTGQVETPDLDAKQLLSEALGVSNTTLISQLREPVNPQVATQFFGFVDQRRSQIPIAYILGHTSFMNTKYRVEEGVLIPRPETEFLVRAVAHYCQTTCPEAILVELGVGTGIIGLELGKLCPKTVIYGWEKSPAAYRIAMQNLSQQGCSNVHFFEGDFFDDFPIWQKKQTQKRPLIAVSNPPYIATSDMDVLEVQIRDYEPHLALDGGKDGLDIITRFIELACTWADQIFVEIGWDQKKVLMDLNQTTQWGELEFIYDFQDKPRVCIVQPRS